MIVYYIILYNAITMIRNRSLNKSYMMVSYTQHVRMYVCVYIYIYTYIHTYIYIHMCVYK